MSATTEGAAERSDGEGDGGKGRDPRHTLAEEIAQGDRTLEMVAHAAQGAELDDEEEGSALDFLLGAPVPVVHEIPVQYETTRGMKPLTFIIHSVDTKKIDAIENKHVQPDGSLDRIAADLEIVALATRALRDGQREIELKSEEFRTVRKRDQQTGEMVPEVLASTTMALEARFRDQLGLLNGVTLRIKQAAGYGPDRVGRAKRVSQAESMMVAASLG